MGESDYEKALAAATDELSALLRERVRIDDRMAQLTKTIEILRTLLTPAPDDKDLNSWRRVVMEVAADISEAGITDAIRQSFADSTSPLTAPQVRDFLVSRKVDLSQYANPLAVIHNTLARLEKQGEVRRLDLPSGTVYTSKGRSRNALADRVASLEKPPHNFIPTNTPADSIPRAPKPPNWDKKK
jgi:hypothetical protein